MFGMFWYKLVMDSINSLTLAQAYTPEQVARMLQMSKNTVYELIKNGEIVAKKLGKLYRVPASSLSFLFTGMDFDLYKAEAEDKKNLNEINKELKLVRKKM